MERQITKLQLAQHNTQDSCWVCIEGVVFDVSEYMRRHPGGRWILINNSGKDATAAFRPVHHSEVAMALMQNFIIGRLSNN